MITENEKVKLEALKQDLAAASVKSHTPGKPALGPVTSRALLYFARRNETVTAGELAAFLRCAEPIAQRHCDVLLENQLIHTSNLDPKDARYNQFGDANLAYKATTAGKKLLVPI